MEITHFFWGTDLRFFKKSTSHIATCVEVCIDIRNVDFQLPRNVCGVDHNYDVMFVT